MSFPTDWADIGVFPLQDHDDSNPPIGIRQQLVGMRVGKLDEAQSGNEDAGIVQYAKQDGKGTLGDVHPWQFYQTKGRNDRPMGSWQNSFGCLSVIPEDGSSSTLRGRLSNSGSFAIPSTTGGHDEEISVSCVPIRSSSYDEDSRYSPITVKEWPKCLPNVPAGMLVLSMAGTEERSQEDLIFPGLDGRIICPNAFPSDSMGTLVVDFQPKDTICMDKAEYPGRGGRAAMIQTVFRVIPMPDQISMAPKQPGNSIALQFAQSGQGGVPGYGLIYAKGDSRVAKDNTPGTKDGPVTGAPAHPSATPITPPPRNTGGAPGSNGAGGGNDSSNGGADSGAGRGVEPGPAWGLGPGVMNGGGGVGGDGGSQGGSGSGGTGGNAGGSEGSRGGGGEGGRSAGGNAQRPGASGSGGTKDEAIGVCASGKFEPVGTNNALAFLAAVPTFGPIHPGHFKKDKHAIGHSKDGEVINSGHIPTTALFYKDQEKDAALEFTNLKYPTPGPLPGISRVHLAYDAKKDHDWITGEASGLWRWFAEIPEFVPKRPPSEPPTTPPTDDDDEDDPKAPTTPPSTPIPPGSTPEGPTSGGESDDGTEPGENEGPLSGGGGVLRPNPPADTGEGGGGSPSRDPSGGRRETPDVPMPDSNPESRGGGGTGWDSPADPLPGFPPLFRPPSEVPFHGFEWGTIGDTYPDGGGSGMFPIQPFGRCGTPPGESGRGGTDAPGPTSGGGVGGSGADGGMVPYGTSGTSGTDMPMRQGGAIIGGARGNFRHMGIHHTVGEVDEDSQWLYAVMNPMMTGFAAQTFRPELLERGYASFIHNPEIPRRILEMDEANRPNVVTLRSWGTQDNGEWGYVERPTTSRARGGTANGGAIYTQPDVEILDLLEGEGSVSSDVESLVGFADGVTQFFGTPNFDGGLDAGSFVIRRNGDALEISQLDSSRNETPLLSLEVDQSSGEAVVTMEGTDATILPVGTTGERPTGVMGMTRFNSTTSRFEGFDGTTWVDFH